MDLEKLFAKHKIRKFDIKLKRLSEEGLKINTDKEYFNLGECKLIGFFVSILEYRIAWENTLLKRYDIRQCSVKVTRLSAQGVNIFYSKCIKYFLFQKMFFLDLKKLEAKSKVRKLPQNVQNVRLHVLWLPINQNSVSSIPPARETRSTTRSDSKKI